MATPVKPFPENSLERKAYDALSGIEFVEPNDRNRLGYHVYLYLSGRLGSLSEAVHLAQPRMTVSPKEVLQILTERLGSAS